MVIGQSSMWGQFQMQHLHVKYLNHELFALSKILCLEWKWYLLYQCKALLYLLSTLLWCLQLSGQYFCFQWQRALCFKCLERNDFRIHLVWCFSHFKSDKPFHNVVVKYLLYFLCPVCYFLYDFKIIAYCWFSKYFCNSNRKTVNYRNWVDCVHGGV